MTDNSFIHVRLYCEAASASEAAAGTTSVVRTLEDFGEVSVGTPEQYWKIPEHYGCTFELRGPMVSRTLLRSVRKRLGKGWVRINGRTYVWNHSENTTFVAESTRWAHLELIEE